jgi:hypothetical protein
MIGPLTLQVGKAVDEFNDILGSKIAGELQAGKRDIELEIPQVPVFTAAHAVYKGDTAHPSILWGNFWFLYYQAWLWRCSKGWRENVTEAWLRRLRDEGKLEQLLGELEQLITSYNR